MGAGASIQINSDELSTLSVEGVGELLTKEGFPQYVEAVKQKGINGTMLIQIGDEKLKEIIPNVRASVVSELNMHTSCVFFFWFRFCFFSFYTDLGD